VGATGPDVFIATGLAPWIPRAGRLVKFKNGIDGRSRTGDFRGCGTGASTIVYGVELYSPDSSFLFVFPLLPNHLVLNDWFLASFGGIFGHPFTEVVFYPISLNGVFLLIFANADISVYFGKSKDPNTRR